MGRGLRAPPHLIVRPMPRTSFRCSYVAAWLAVKRAWKLSMDEAEYETIETLDAEVLRLTHIS